MRDVLVAFRRGAGVAGFALVGMAFTGCTSTTPRSPAQAARERVEFMRERGVGLTPAQVGRIRRLPYASAESTQRHVEQVLRDPDGLTDLSPDREPWRRFRVSTLIEERRKSETEEPMREDQ